MDRKNELLITNHQPLFTGKIKTYQELIIWQKGIELVKIIYKVTEDFPQKELFGLTNQMRRAAISVPSNIAEGQARHHTKEFIQFLYQALGSLAELDTQTIIAKELNYLAAKKLDAIENQIAELQKMVHSLLKRLTTIH